MRTRLASSAVAAFAALLLGVAASGASVAAAPTEEPAPSYELAPTEGVTHTTVNEDGTINYFGNWQTQSTDPTRWDYVPEGPAVDDGMITPMDATGVAQISIFNYSWNGLTVPVPRGYLGHTISGSGLSLNAEGAYYSPVIGPTGTWGVNICNWRIDFQNRTESGATQSTSTGPVHAGCSVGGIERGRGAFKVKTGVQCARLFVNGTYRGEQCHSVHP